MALLVQLCFLCSYVVERATRRAAASSMLANESGEASFSCSRRGLASAGYAFATTQQIAKSAFYSQNAVWSVGQWTGFVAARDRAGEAAESLTRIVNSLELDA